jgi:DNA-binding transcriptional MocR family regulator
MVASTHDNTLYVDVADRVAGLIDRGTLRPGQKIPSVRNLSRQLRVSISTVLQAYRLLEDRGRIEARPQSGYYVRPPLAPPPADPAPALLRCRAAPSSVTVVDVVARMLQQAAVPGTVNLGGAIPSDAGLPTQQLNRISAAIARRTRRGNNVYELPPGNPELRAQIARRYLEAGCALAPDDIVTTCGCQEALALCLRAVARLGDVVAVESPTFYGHLPTIETFGMRALEIPTSPRDGISLEALANALRRRGRGGGGRGRRISACVVISNCQNPLGSVMPDER